MTDLEALLAGIVAEPQDDVRWLVMSDWLEENGEVERAELVRVHREMLRLCTDPDQSDKHAKLQERLQELLRTGVQPCVPQKTVELPGGVTMRFSYIPPGSFLIGSPEHEQNRRDDELQHQVTLSQGFWMGVAPVTQEQWQAVMGNNPSHFSGPQNPVEQVIWDDAVEYCRVLKEKTGMELQLPTETQWEYAARASTTTPFYWGTELNGTQANCDGRFLYGTSQRGPYLKKTAAVGSYAKQYPHPWGLCDVHGNVFEWCQDWYDANYYGRSPEKYPIGEDAEMLCKVLRGGSWNFFPWDCRSSSRNGYESSHRGSYIGFRLCTLY